jgi:exosortase H (IPTLxxWG-CTERM-specific)
MKRFFVVFVILLLTLFTVELLHPVQQWVVLPWTTLLAQGCQALVVAFDPAVQATGKVLMNTQNGFGVSIEPGCNGVEAFVVLFAALVAFPRTRWQHKLVGIAVGFVAIQVVNVVRIISLFYLGQWDRQLFEFAHVYLWQSLIMVDVLMVWLVWLRWIHRQGANDAGVDAAA